jgi:hypothetical protein
MKPAPTTPSAPISLTEPIVTAVFADLANMAPSDSRRRAGLRKAT